MLNLYNGPEGSLCTSSLFSCTAYTSLRPSWTSVRTFQRPVRSSQIRCQYALLRGQCAVFKNQHFSDICQCVLLKGQCTLLTSLTSSKLKDQYSPAKYWSSLLKTSTAHFFSIALRTSDISAALFWSTILRTHFRQKLSGLTLCAIGCTSCMRQLLLFVVGASGILRKWNFQRTPEIFQGFWIKDFFFKNFVFKG